MLSSSGSSSAKFSTSEHDGECGLFRAHRAIAIPGPTMPGFPSNQLWRRHFGKCLEPVPFPRRGPQRRHCIGYDETCRGHRILGPEVVGVTGFAREVDQLLQRGRRRPAIVSSQRVLSLGGQPLEGESPACPLTRRHASVPRQIRTRSRQRHEVGDLVPHRHRVGQLRLGTGRAGATVARELGLDTFTHVRRTPPVEIPQRFPQPVLIESAHHTEELFAIHTLGGHYVSRPNPSAAGSGRAVR